MSHYDCNNVKIKNYDNITINITCSNDDAGYSKYTYKTDEKGGAIEKLFEDLSSFEVQLNFNKQTLNVKYAFEKVRTEFLTDGGFITNLPEYTYKQALEKFKEYLNEETDLKRYVIKIDGFYLVKNLKWSYRYAYYMKNAAIYDNKQAYIMQKIYSYKKAEIVEYVENYRD